MAGVKHLHSRPRAELTATISRINDKAIAAHQPVGDARIHHALQHVRGEVAVAEVLVVGAENPMVRSLLLDTGLQNLRFGKVQLTITYHGRGAGAADNADTSIRQEP